MEDKKTQQVFKVLSHVVAILSKSQESAYFCFLVLATIKQTNFNDCKSGVQ